MNLSKQTKLIHPSWKNHLKKEFSKDYFIHLCQFLDSQKNTIIYPKEEDVFNALNKTPLNNVKAVIIGQDPYHGENQAHGLSFSVQQDIKIPPSLKNIYKELNDDLNLDIPDHGNLNHWAQEGVLLLNNVLTVEAKKAGSHQKKGWEIFTDKIVEILNQECNHLVFILWGSPAQKKARNVNDKKHFIIKSPHPSPLSSYRGFFGSKPFSQANQYLRSQNINEIDWRIKSVKS